MIELIILLGLGWALKGFLQPPSEQDTFDYLVMSEFEIDDDEMY